MTGFAVLSNVPAFGGTRARWTRDALRHLTLILKGIRGNPMYGVAVGSMRVHVLLKNARNNTTLISNPP